MVRMERASVTRFCALEFAMINLNLYLLFPRKSCETIPLRQRNAVPQNDLNFCIKTESVTAEADAVIYVWLTKLIFEVLRGEID